MESNSQPSASNPPPKPWQQGGASPSPAAPFKPPSAGSTSDIVEASGTARPGEIVSSSDRNAAVNRNTLTRPVPTRPWEQNYNTNTYGGTGAGYGSTMNYNSGLGSGMYGSSYGGGLGGGLGGGMYGGGMYGSSMYNRGGYGGGLYGSSGMYGGGMYNSGLGGPMGGYGGGMGVGPYGGDQDPNNPYGGPPSPPGFWISVMRVMQGVVNFFGRISILIDQNTQAFHMFMTALLQLFDRSGLLYGELARFVLRLLGIKAKPKKVDPAGPNGHQLGPNGHPLGPNGHQLPGPHNYSANVNTIGGPKPASGGSWDNVWGNDASQ